MSRRMGVVGTVGMAAVLAAGCDTSEPVNRTLTPRFQKMSLDSYQYRATFQTPFGVFVKLYAEKVEYPKDADGITTDIIMIDVYCPKEKACEELVERKDITGSDVSLGGVDPMKYEQLEMVNQRSSYVSCGNPVPSPFTVGDACP